ncbi:hypothetical protein ONE63_000123 [Megalurothrips usitatus]|uniref:Reverse transcriptase domain-containing protein n=1 Tax=Megalurothrips usitatus TaxID=439358 RepID=A0AAV7Y2D6_9NEOP|nr:hypothetical protein ONE63_000123 [Megalurothrips usitatus]
MESLDLLNFQLKSISRRNKGLLSVAHINAQSLNDSDHFTEFNSVFGESGFDVVAVSETFFNSSSTVDVRNYKCFNVNRINKNGGGVAIYIAERLKAKVVATSDGEANKPEYLLLEVKCEHENVLVACAYRPPKIGAMDLLTFCESTLDVIATNMSELVVEYGQTVAPGFSNHDLIYAIVDLKVNTPSKKYITFRDFKNMDPAAVAMDAEMLSWSEVYESPTIDEKLACFNSIITELMEKHAPLRTVAVKRPDAPWMTHDILLMISNRNKARKKHLSTNLPVDFEAFRILRNRTNGKSNKKCDVPVDISPNDLNQHYLNVSTVCNDNEVNNAILHYEALTEPTEEPFHFKYVTPWDIIDSITSITSNAQGEDGISVVFLKACLVQIVCVLEHIFNFSLQSSVFPCVWKLANVLPIPKVANPVNCKDYRPVSILCLLSKVLEKIVHSQVYEYLAQNKLINPLQSGFRPGHSTKTALLKVADDIRLAIDQRKLVLAVLLDFSKAFDKVHHGLLLVKMRKLGFSRSVIKWFYVYLCDRAQRVKLGSDFVSNWDFSDTGVPQGSVLGPLLFLIYCNDISDVISNCTYHLYADDLQLYLNFGVKSVTEAVKLVNADLASVLQYAKCHNLSLNIEKTQPIIYGSNTYLKILQKGSQISIDNIPVPYKDTVTNLGVIFDQSLSWTPQCVRVINSVFKNLAVVRRNFCYLPFSVRKMICQSFIFPTFDYSAALMTNLSATNCIKIQRAQNSCIRFVTKTPKYEHITPMYKELDLLKFTERRDLIICTTIRSIFKTAAPPYLLQMFTTSSSVNMRRNRQSSHNLVVPIHRTCIYNKSFCVPASRLWNKYSIHSYFSCSTANTLKRKVHTELMKLYD